ncbi:hypothetical protein B0T20DRAFT_390193 [Sordaria brevicollis]|uniref:Transmembrane protein n=1 Tax=Sordaria brevicollis TaxID=83679 RepID=A0AAE0PLW2_SORBR|nr:hypothetical protein B0T20DRAFT_390193 [Sordaria brevicollis]
MASCRVAVAWYASIGSSSKWKLGTVTTLTLLASWAILAIQVSLRLCRDGSLPTALFASPATPQQPKRWNKLRNHPHGRGQHAIQTQRPTCPSSATKANGQEDRTYEVSRQWGAGETSDKMPVPTYMIEGSFKQLTLNNDEEAWLKVKLDMHCLSADLLRYSWKVVAFCFPSAIIAAVILITIAHGNNAVINIFYFFAFSGSAGLAFAGLTRQRNSTAEAELRRGVLVARQRQLRQ